MMTRLPALAVSCVAGLLLAGCAQQTSYVRPAANLPSTYVNGQPEATGGTMDAWWKRFGDARLDALVDQVLARNNSLAQSMIAVERAQLQVGLSVANPTVSASLSSNETVLGSSALSPNSVSTGIDGGQIGSTHSSGIDVSVSYELDLFGRLAATRDVKRFEAQASAGDYAAARLSLIANTVDFYYQLAYLNERASLARDSVGYAEKTLQLARALRSAGAASQLELSEAEQSLLSQRSTLEDLQRQRSEVRSAIDLLLDGQRWLPDAEPSGLGEASPPPVAPGMPADLLSRRPDVVAAELRLREQLRQVDVTHLNFYPRLTLTGELGTSSQELSNVVNNPVGILGANLLLPFLQVDQVRLQNRDAKLAYRNAVIGFRQTLYQALTDVENALVDRNQYAKQSRLLDSSLQAARRVEALDQTLYRAGSTTLKTWLDAQQTRRDVEASLAQSLLNERTSQVTLYKALGGDERTTFQ